MSFRLVSKSVTLNDLQRQNGPFCVISSNSVASGAHCVKVVDVVVKSLRSLSHLLMSFLYNLCVLHHILETPDTSSLLYRLILFSTSIHNDRLIQKSQVIWNFRESPGNTQSPRIPEHEQIPGSFESTIFHDEITKVHKNSPNLTFPACHLNYSGEAIASSRSPDPTPVGRGTYPSPRLSPSLLIINLPHVLLHNLGCLD